MNMNRKEKLDCLRQKMKENHIDIYYIPTGDFHGSEYVSEHFRVRDFLTGFDGSAGFVIVTDTEAGLWTDGRYFIQAEKQLQGTGITLYRQGQEGVPTAHEYILSHMPEGGVLGMDGRVVSAVWTDGLQRLLQQKHATLFLEKDLVGEFWEGRPEIEFHKAWLYGVEYAGISRKDKLQRLREWMAGKKIEQFVMTSLDEIAWLLNIRGEDIPCNPVVFSYLIVRQAEAFFFVAPEVFDETGKAELAADGIILRSYDAVFDDIGHMTQPERTYVDKRSANAKLVHTLQGVSKVFDTLSPVIAWKAVKNDVEIQNAKEVHIRDGVAVTKFLYWLKANKWEEPLTELSVSKKLESFRKEQMNYLGPSFDTIAGYAEHGAIVHYSATEETDKSLEPNGFLLVDSGGQYLGGTTDITRTIMLGKATEEEKRYYTAVLRGNLNLCGAKFLYGCSGVALDYAARKPLWDMGCDFNHGTGHGVGALLNVHEGQNAFRYKILNGPGKNPVLEAGMITSDEPGIYLEGKFGIRLENLILCIALEKNEFGQFMGFEPLTYVPFDRDAIDALQMSEEEKKRLNQYHTMVFEKISPYLKPEEKAWLSEVCAEIK